MTDMMNFHSVPQGGQPYERAPAVQPVPTFSTRHEPIGTVFDVSGGGARIQMSGRRLRELAGEADPSVAMSGQVGSQVKLESGGHWLLANVRHLRVTDAEGDMVAAEIDFLGEGDEDEQAGRLINFKRGITSYPIPGNRVFPVTASDLKQMFAADERPHIEIGTVYPTRDVRAALYIDALLGKHFALLGSTWTGDSATSNSPTSASG